MNIDEKIRRNGPKIHSITKIPVRPFTSFNLDNGLPVYYIRQGSQELVKLDIVFKGGRHHELHKSLNRIFAGVIKEGTQKDSAETLYEFFDRYGASYTSRSSLDYTTFTLMSLSKFFPILIQKFSEIILEPLFAEEEILKCIDNNCRKLELDQSKNELVAYRLLTEKLFGEDAVYGYNSTKENFQQITRERLVEYHQDMMTNQECTLFLCGQYDDTVEQSINQAFGQWSYTKGRKIHYKKSSFTNTDQFKFPAVQQHQSAIRIGRKFGNRKDKAYAQMTFLNNVLGGYFGSRLMKNIREEKGYTYNVFSSLDTLLCEGYFYISTEVSPHHVKDASNEIVKEMELLRQVPLEKEELEMNRNYILGNLLTAVDGPFQTIRLIKSAVLNGETREDVLHTIETFKSITAREVQHTAEEFLDPSTFMHLTIG